MANYIDAQRTTFTKDEEIRFRKLFNQWAASINGYNRSNLGNEIKIVEVYNSPLYCCEIHTQYDHRKLNMNYKRVNGKVCPPRTIENISQIDRWGLVPFPTIYTDRNKSYYVSGSEYITSCPTCNGASRVSCSKCGGKGKITRKIVKVTTCKECKGYGYIYETRHKKEHKQVLFNGKYVWRYVDTEYSEKVTCPSCGGLRKFEDITYRDEACQECHSSGKVTCNNCLGDGKMIHYWQLSVEQYCETFTEYRFPSVISNEDAQKMKDLVIKPSYAWERIETIRSDNGKFSNNNLASKPLVGSIISKFPSKVKQTLTNTVVCFSDITIDSRCAKTIVYQVDGERYTCLLLTGDEWKLLTVTSPISKRVRSLKESVNAYCREHKYGKAWALLQEVNQYPQAGSSEAQMQSELEERMAMTTKFGANIALVLCTLFLSPLLYALYGPYKFYAFWSKWLMDKFDLSAGHLMLFTIIAIMFITIKYVIPTIPESAHQVASPSKRFVYGFKFGAKAYIFLAVAAAILSYTGILQLATGAAMLALKIVVFIVMLAMFLISGIFKIFT